MPDQEVIKPTRVEMEFSKTWCRLHPELLVGSLFKFVHQHPLGEWCVDIKEKEHHIVVIATVPSAE